jgi:hypothetical protein
MVIYVDIDETICHTPAGQEYNNARPIYTHIDKINALYEQGHLICYWTARGTVSKIDWSELTKEQLKSWGVKCHNLYFGKPFYDILIDDKAHSKIEDIDDVIRIRNDV